MCLPDLDLHGGSISSPGCSLSNVKSLAAPLKVLVQRGPIRGLEVRHLTNLRVELPPGGPDLLHLGEELGVTTDRTLGRRRNLDGSRGWLRPMRAEAACSRRQIRCRS